MKRLLIGCVFDPFALDQTSNDPENHEDDEKAEEQLPEGKPAWIIRPIVVRRRGKVEIGRKRSVVIPAGVNPSEAVARHESIPVGSVRGATDIVGAGVAGLRSEVLRAN